MNPEYAAVEAAAAVLHYSCIRDAKPGHHWSEGHRHQDLRAAQDFIHGLAGKGWMLHRDVFGEARH